MVLPLDVLVVALLQVKGTQRVLGQSIFLLLLLVLLWRHLNRGLLARQNLQRRLSMQWNLLELREHMRCLERCQYAVDTLVTQVGQKMGVLRLLVLIWFD